MARATLNYYTDAGGDWRWRLKAANGRVIATSGESYSAKGKAETGFDAVRRAIEVPGEYRIQYDDGGRAK